MPAFRGETQCGTRAELRVIKSRENKRLENLIKMQEIKLER